MILILFEKILFILIFDGFVANDSIPLLIIISFLLLKNGSDVIL